MTTAVVARGKTLLTLTLPSGKTELHTLANGHRTLLSFTVGAPGKDGEPGPAFSGFGFVDYSDLDSGEPLLCPAGEWVRLARDLQASAANAKLRGPFEAHAYWQNGKIVPKQAGESFALSVAYRVRPFVTDGFLLISVRPGGNPALDQGPSPIKLFAEAGAEESGFSTTRVINVRNTFATQGAEVWVKMTRGGELLDFSPEFNPISEAGA